MKTEPGPMTEREYALYMSGFIVGIAGGFVAAALFLLLARFTQNENGLDRILV